MCNHKVTCVFPSAVPKSDAEAEAQPNALMSFVVRLAYRHALIFLADDRRIMVEVEESAGMGTGNGNGKEV